MKFLIRTLAIILAVINALFALLMPALFNALLIGWELALYIGGGFWFNALYVAIGEAAVLLTLERFCFTP